MSNKLAAALLDQGVKKGDRVGILMHKSVESIISLFGIMKAGAIYVPLDPAAPVSRICGIIALCSIECLVTAHEHLERIWSERQDAAPLKKAILTGKQQPEGAYRNDIDCLEWQEIEPKAPAEHTRRELSDTSPAYILHTSGSTGKPKGVVISHLNALTFVNMAVDLFGVNENDRIANQAPLHFDLSVFDVFSSVKAGATLVMVPEALSPFSARLAEFIDKERISIWNSVSSVLTMMADRGKLDRFGFENLRLVHFSGDIMPVKYLRILKRHMNRAAFYNIYGQTEANSSLFYPVREIPGNEAWKIPIGKPLPNFEVFALNDANEMISRPGEEGELYVSASTVALGYWNDEKTTLEKFIADPRYSGCAARVYRTGDLVRVDDEGNYTFAGRTDHMIKSRGHRIELSEIEIVLNSHPDVSKAIVLAIPNELMGNRIVAYISPTNAVQVTAEELTAYCHASLPRYMVPEEIIFIEGIPLTTTGKADRRSMTESYLSPKM
jgi:amino acid adenylation domain-containing protein